MGCTSSSLSDWLRPGRKIYSKNAQKKTIFVLGRTVSSRAYLSQDGKKARVRSWSPEQTEALCCEAIQIFEREQNESLSQVERKGNFAGRMGEDDRAEGGPEGITMFSSSRLLETPPRLCSEQERRLRCANLEVLHCIGDLDSDEEEEDFEFAKVEDSPKSCITEVAVTASSSEDRSSMQTDLFSVNWGKLALHNGCSISEPEFEILISSETPEESSDSTLFPVSTFGNESIALSHSGLLERDVQSLPGSVLNAHVFHCVPVLEKFPSEVLRQSYFYDKNYSISGRSFVSPSSNHSVSNDLSPCFALSPPFHLADSYAERESVDVSPLSVVSACHGGSQFSANESVSDSLNEPGMEETLSFSPTSEWSFQSPDVRWDLVQSLPEWEASFHSALMHFKTDHPFRSAATCVDTYQRDGLIPGLPDDLAQLCLMRVPFVKYHPSLRMVCRRWRAVLSSEEFFTARKALGIHEAHISFVVHGNKVQIFNLQTHKWFCLPPLPREDGNVSPDWGIDPYEWWQIDTVAVTEGTLFVIGGDQAEIHSFTRPSKPTNRVHKYDFCQNRWIPVTPMQVARSHAAAVCLGNWIFVAGGSEDREEGLSAEAYNFHQNSWSVIANMNSSMRMCVGMEHGGKFYVKGENTGPGSLVEGEIYDVARDTWNRMSAGMRRGLARGPIASANSILFVADWKDSQLKMYDAELDSWKVATQLPARISRLVGHGKNLYGLTGKIKVDPYNHHVISDAPAEVWRLDLGRGVCLCNQGRQDRICKTGEASNFDPWREDAGISFGRRTGGWDDMLTGGMESVLGQQESVNAVERHGGSGIGDAGYVWECLWRDPKQMVKTGGLAWVPCIAHCTLFED